MLRIEITLKGLYKKLSAVRIKPADIIVTAFVLLMTCLVIVPSLIQCAENRAKAECEQHMYALLSTLAKELEKETEAGGTYWRDLLENGNYQKLLAKISNKTPDSQKYPASDYYIRGGGDKITIICKKHKDVSEKDIRLSVIHNVYIDAAERPMTSEKIVYLKVTGPDTYYVNEVLDEDNPDKMKFTGMEIDEAIQNLRVYAIHEGGYKEELPRSQYTVTAEELNLAKTGQTTLTIKAGSASLWDNSAYAQYNISVIGEEDVAPLIVDGGINGRFELAAWDWLDFVEEASMEEEGKDFDASIILFNGSYYYYPDGLHIINDNENTTPFMFALDIDNLENPAYNIKFDTDSVILNSSDEEDIHEGSLKVENELVYIWQDQPSKELPAGWIRVYCELRKY